MTDNKLRTFYACLFLYECRSGIGSVFSVNYLHLLLIIGAQFGILLSMITKLTVVKSESTNVFVNQGIELALFDKVEEGEAILYLWTNENTVVIGRNQDAYQEVNVDLLESEGGLLARRLSGGGAVYHDLGNINFTFFGRTGDFDVERNRKILLSALKFLGLNATLTGRNDIEIDGFKVSGNAYYRKDGHEYHHGTMLVTSPSEKVARYLTPPESKFVGKKVKSVKSRVSCLTAFDENITKEKFADAIIDAFKAEYGLPCEEMQPFALGGNAIMGGTMIFASDDWRYGKKEEYDVYVPLTVDGNKINVAVAVKDDVVTAARAYTDSMDSEISEFLENQIIGKNLKTDNNEYLEEIKKVWYEI